MIFVDPPAWPWRGRLYSHLVSDSDVGELHELAARAGVHPRAFDGDHYDVPQELLAAVVAAGAVPVDGHELVRRLNASGLRVRKRRGDKLLDSVPQGLAFLSVPHRVDVIRSSVPPAESSTVAAVMFVRDEAGRLLLVRHPRRGGWEAPGGWVDAGESGLDAAVRELREETGLQLQPRAASAYGYERIVFAGELPATPWQPVSYITVFDAVVGACQAKDTTLAGLGPEGSDVAWVEPGELVQRCGSAAWFPLMAARAGLELPLPAWARG